MELARLVPDLAEPAAEPASAVGVSTQGRLFELALGLLERMAADRPLVLVIEDLHWSDRSTRDLLAFLVRNLRAERIVFVATYRSDELHRGHPLRPFLAELDRGGADAALDLRPFDRAELAEQLDGILGAPAGAATRRSVFERSRGQRVLRRGARAPPERGPASSRRCCATSCSCGSSAAARRRRRCCGLSPSAAGACSSGCWRRSASWRTTERDEALREAVEHRLLVPAGEDVYAFRHALLREAVYEELLPGERNRLHAAYGAALAARRSSRAVTTRPPPIWRTTGTRRTTCRGRSRASVAAGGAAERRSGFAEARAHYERALELWDRRARTPRPRAGIERRGADAAGRRGREPGRRPRRARRR